MGVDGIKINDEKDILLSNDGHQNKVIEVMFTGYGGVILGLGRKQLLISILNRMKILVSLTNLMSLRVTD